MGYQQRVLLPPSSPPPYHRFSPNQKPNKCVRVFVHSIVKPPILIEHINFIAIHVIMFNSNIRLCKLHVYVIVIVRFAVHKMSS